MIPSSMPADADLNTVPQHDLDQLRYDLDPGVRNRARSESQRRLHALLQH